ncbi:MAG TPA: RNA-binding cell elongation regulator Jag/EloR [Bacillota bacterium]|nr:RNA-binding cell elongation regulator Jag/EloR [Bacillota bacterium]
MRTITARGETVEQAVQSALEQLDTTKDRVEVTIVDEGSRGFLGVFGTKPAIVSVTTKEDPIERTEAFIKKVTQEMNVEVEVKTTVHDKQVTFELFGEKIAVLIGKRGQTLNALQYLLQLVINKDSNQFYYVTLDAEGYRGRRKETLQTLASNMAEKAKRIGKKVALEPMPAYERKIIHTELQDREDVKTFSGGKEPHRHIIIEAVK